MSYKNSFTGEVISPNCHQKLPVEIQQDYIKTIDSITHTVNRYRGGFMLYILQDDNNSVMFGGLSDSNGGSYDGF